MSTYHVKDGGWIISASDRPAWADITSAGIFRVDSGGQFFRHYQDCDEYWLIYRGRALVDNNGERSIVGPGDIVATLRGRVHDVLEVYEPLESFWFEAAMRPGGTKRHNSTILRTRRTRRGRAVPSSGRA